MKFIASVLAFALACGVCAAAERTTRMQMMPHANNDETVNNAAIDTRLSRFAAANAGNPGAQAALDSAAAEIKSTPDAFINADGTVNRQALTPLLERHF